MILSSHQPNFAPYMGFFYKMFRSDVFVLSDEHQFSTSGMHNYNYIRIGQQKKKITVPVVKETKARIEDAVISYQTDWIGEIEKTFLLNYKKAAHFDEAAEFLFPKLEKRYDKIADLNIDIICSCAELFGIECEIKIGHELHTEKHKMERIIELCKIVGADTYYSGIGGKAYNVDTEYEKNGIRLIYSDYEPVRYKQTNKPFIENLSVIDWIFNKGFSLPKEWRP